MNTKIRLIHFEYYRIKLSFTVSENVDFQAAEACFMRFTAVSVPPVVRDLVLVVVPAVILALRYASRQIRYP